MKYLERTRTFSTFCFVAAGHSRAGPFLSRGASVRVPRSTGWRARSRQRVSWRGSPGIGRKGPRRLARATPADARSPSAEEPRRAPPETARGPPPRAVEVSRRRSPRRGPSTVLLWRGRSAADLLPARRPSKERRKKARARRDPLAESRAQARSRATGETARDRESSGNVVPSLIFRRPGWWAGGPAGRWGKRWPRREEGDSCGSTVVEGEGCLWQLASNSS